MGRKKKALQPVNQAIDDGIGEEKTADGRRTWKRISAKQRPYFIDALVPLLAANEKHEDIAVKLRVQRNLVDNYARDPEVTAKVEEFRIGFWQEAKQNFLALGQIAIDTFKDLMQNARSEHVRFEAANATLVHLQAIYPDAEQGGQALHENMLDELRKIAASRPAPQISIGTMNVTAQAVKDMIGQTGAVVDGEVVKEHEAGPPGLPEGNSEGMAVENQDGG